MSVDAYYFVDGQAVPVIQTTAYEPAAPVLPLPWPRLRRELARRLKADLRRLMP